MFLIYIYFFDSLDYRYTGKKDVKPRCSKLREAFEDPLMLIDLSFFSSALNVFTTYNKFLQRSDPLSYKVYHVTENLVRRLAMHILTPQTIKNSDSLESLNHSTGYLRSLFWRYFRHKS